MSPVALYDAAHTEERLIACRLQLHRAHNSSQADYTVEALEM